MEEQGPDFSSALKKGASAVWRGVPTRRHSPCTLDHGHSFSTWIQKAEVVGGQSRWTTRTENPRSLAVRLTVSPHASSTPV